MKWFVAVSGNIGSGKSTITTLLSEKLGWRPYYEIVEENPYLPDFYREMPRWSFPLQVFFLSKRFQHHRQILEAPGSVIQDRTIYEDAEIFARNLYLQGLMDERDYRTYYELFTTMVGLLRPPDLIIYLKASIPTLLERIRRRGRDYEQGIRPEYLAQLDERYREWTGRFTLCPVLTVDADRLDLHNLDALVMAMRSALPTLFPLSERA
ncbi:MAG: deoxynucleoside kinase [Armatimonadota bacterium]|nr:deoxynucleoside kinase [Armatimonadota bacterium]MDR7451617.1 deoxynucleoside kinase [Armatimonadota bacterium]MDR7467663.1 deoxynucleoside kinase [Armatimonadota bacterium]MDR7492586.1 deoxynucleoside kinase [Armatimonadota bacterium]MDR7499946.1 deoxynucleoside kinase [Armatimonadota bacterium]